MDVDAGRAVWVAVGAGVAVAALPVGLLALVLRAPDVDVPSFGGPSVTAPVPAGSTPSAGRLPIYH